MVLLLALPTSKLGWALRHSVMGQTVVAQVVFSDKVDSLLVISYHITVLRGMILLAEYTSVLFLLSISVSVLLLDRIL